MSVFQFLKRSEEKDRQRRAEAQFGGQETSDPFGVPSFQVPSTQLRNQYIVPDHWDQTPEQRLPLDRYVTDQYVGQAIYAAMELPSATAYQTFGTDYPADAAYFFSGPPYSIVAVTDFGYRNPTHLFLADEDLRDENGHDSNKNNDNNDKNDGNGNGQHRQTIEDYFGNCSD